MNRSAEVPPADTLLCEACGYILEGLPRDSRCPECGQEIARSLPALRRPPAWEERPGFRSWVRTTTELLVRPGRFFRGLAVRGEQALAARFAAWHVRLSAGMLGAALALHAQWMLGDWLRLLILAYRPQTMVTRWQVTGLLLLPAAGLVWLTFRASAWLAARLTEWEARYRGLRLPLPVVQRALAYHTAHYLPVALVGLLTVAGYRGLVSADILSDLHAPQYLYVLSSEVILAAAWLFHTYWLAMRRLMYANG
jgi:hypothetical protein